MNRALFTNAALALLVAAVGAWLWLRPAAGPTEPEFAVSARKPADTKILRLERPGEPAIVLERRAAGWRQVAPLEARADAMRVEGMLEVLKARSRTRLPAQDLERFDLHAPVARLTVDGEMLAFGAINPVTGEQYLLAGGQVFLVRPDFGMGLPPRGETMASKLLLGEDEQPAAFLLPGRRVERREGKWEQSPPPADGAALSQDDYQRWADRWRFASSLLTLQAPGQPRGDKLTLVLADGRKIELLAREQAGGFLLVRLDEKLEYRFAAEQRARLLDGPAPPR